MKVTAATPPIPAVVIELNAEEAQAVMDVLGQVTGPMHSPRKYTEELWTSLKKVGYNWSTGDRLEGTVRFTR